MKHSKLIKDKKTRCLIRGVLVAATPEETVRQAYLKYLVEKIKIPLSMIAVEKSLKQLTTKEFDSSKIPDRRVDVVCYAKQIRGHRISPLIIVECKSGLIKEQAVKQVLGYNYFVNAPFIALVSEKEARFFRADHAEVIKEFETLFDYQSLKEMCLNPG